MQKIGTKTFLTWGTNVSFMLKTLFQISTPFLFLVVKMATQSTKKANLFRRSLIFGYMVDFRHDGTKTGGFIYWEPDQSLLGKDVR
jgi:hypothetical protein